MGWILWNLLILRRKVWGIIRDLITNEARLRETLLKIRRKKASAEEKTVEELLA